MQPDARETADRGDFPRAVTPWDRPDWRVEALRWAADALAAHGLAENGPREVRLRPWSVLVRFSVGGSGPVWFKANPPAGAFEAGLTRALADWVPGSVLRPLAVDAARGWALLPDGGPLLRQTLDEDRRGGGPRAWEAVLGRYAELQRSLLPHTPEIEALGVPGARTAALPGILDRMAEENTALDDTDRRALHALRPRFADWCAELAGAGIGDTLDHCDLHDAQVFTPEPGRYTFFDWGDACVTHPFCSLLVPGRAAARRYGPDVLPRLRDAYLEPWTGAGRTPGELRRAARLAWRLAAIGRVSAWGRFFPAGPRDADGGAAGDTGDADRARWLRELLNRPPL
ncbi:aminoglycoside phosphotransferase family protein [Streptomyces racemochromogenes]|uniref:aminoglycoside phosphotransferase family protein n=1 Tax=Streptomyces racemochromogenes TaxID=67353 RepID=UPI0031F0D077